MKSYQITVALRRAFPKKKILGKEIDYPDGKDRFGYRHGHRLQFASDLSTVKQAFDCHFSSGKELDAFLAQIQKQPGALNLKSHSDIRAWGTFTRATTQAERDAVDAHIQVVKDAKEREVALQKKQRAADEARQAARDLNSNDSAVSLAAAPL